MGPTQMKNDEAASFPPVHNDEVGRASRVRPYSAPVLPIPPDPPNSRFNFSWGAVAAGLAIAIALDIFFAEIGFGANLGIIARDSSAGAITASNAIATLITGIIALFAGAWVAGRLARTHNHVEGSLHGLAVWAAGAVVMLALAFGAAGVIGSGMLGLVGKGMETAGKLVQTAMPSWDGIKTQLESAVDRHSADLRAAPAKEKAPAGDASGSETPHSPLIDQSRLLQLASHHFAIDAKPASAAERDEFVQLIASQLGVSQELAEQTLKQWDSVWQDGVQRYEAAKQEAAQAAEKARLMAIAAATWAAVGMALGAIVALFGGVVGTRCRCRNAECELRHAHQNAS